MIMWIILGSLIAVVAIFLIFTGVMDRKKNKKLRMQNRELELMRENARSLIAIWISIVIDNNNQLLKSFMPSIGEFKMNDIRQAAKKALNILTEQKPYQLIENSQAHADIKQRFFELTTSSSNNWLKHNLETVTFFQKIAAEATQQDQNQAFKNEAQTIIQGVYNEFTK